MQNIRKSSGQFEAFSRDKLRHSLLRTGLNDSDCEKITDKVSHNISDGTRTRDIYKQTLNLVKQSSSLAAIHYSLKRSIFELGPAGHNFELFVSKYFEELDFQTEVSKIVRGEFVKHEIDVIAKNKLEKYYIECKFHNRYGIKNDVKTTLYVKARWDDVRNGPEGKDLTGFYLATNTSFSLDALTYAQGVGLQLLGINAPSEVPFIEQVKRMKLYPITSLRKLNRNLIQELLKNKVVLAREIPANLHLLLKFGLNEESIKDILHQVDILEDKT